MESILLEIGAEANVLALELLVLVRDQEPRDNTANSSECSSNEEYALDTLLGIRERVLDRGEDLRADGGSGLAESGGKTKEVATNRCGEGLGAADESSDLGWSVRYHSILQGRLVHVRQVPSLPRH